MSPSMAAIACGLLILTLFLWDRERKSRVSSALWLPLLWLSIGASRTVSQWLGGVPTEASGEQFVDGTPLDAFIFALLLAAGLVVLFARRQRVKTFLRANAPLLIFFAYCAASFLWSDFPFVAFKRWIKAVGDLVMVLVVLTDPEPTAAIRRLLARAGLVLIPLSILFIRYYPDLGRGYSPWTGEAFNNGVATQKNSLGYICLIFGLGSLWYLLEVFRRGALPRRIWPVLAHGTILALALWLFRMADSATSFSCFLIGGVLMAATSWRAIARKPAIVHFLVGTLLFVVVYSLLLNPGAGLTETVGRDATLTGRTAIWDQVLGMTVNPFIGAGYESFWLGDRLQKIWATNWAHPNQAHNGYIEVYLDLGWIGVALIGFVMVWGYRGVVRALRRDPEAGRLKLALLVVAAVYNLTEHAFRELHPVWIVFLLAVIVVPEPLRREER